MFRVHRRFRAPLIAALLAFTSLAVVPAGAAANFQTGVQDPLLYLNGPASEAAYQTVQQVGANLVRVDVNWAAVAPRGAVAPAGFDATNPSDAHYRWTALDVAVRAAAAHHDRILLEMIGAPAWAQAPGEPASAATFGGPWDPNAAEFGQFMFALATRYSGTFPDPLVPGQALPRVKSFEAWDEPNLPGTLQAPDVVGEYASLLNAAYSSLKAVHPDNVVVAGALAPVYVGAPSIAPLDFTARLLCLRQTHARGHYVRASTCPARAHFDAFSVHPYTLTATPTTHAANPGDTFVADVGKVRSLLDTAEKLRTASPHIRYGLWVSEWAWFSNPPNSTLGDRDSLAARYVAASMYEMWHAGASLVVWLRIRYSPGDLVAAPGLIYAGALFTVANQPTVKMAAFQFPVFASVTQGKGFVWGRTPVARRTVVFVQHERRHRWKTIGHVRTGSDGVFELHFKAKGNGFYRARVKHGLVSLPYNSRPIAPKFDHTLPGGLRDG